MDITEKQKNMDEDTHTFDYSAAVAELEKIARTVENPETPVDDIDGYIRRSEKLIADCRAWLRGVRERTLNMDTK